MHFNTSQHLFNRAIISGLGLCLSICSISLAYAGEQAKPASSSDTLPAIVSLLFVDQPPTANTFRLSVTSGNGGSVNSSPTGINCGSDCSQVYDKNQVVQLSPIAENGYRFSQWNGDCTGSGICNVTMSTDRQVSATFEEIIIPPGGILIENYVPKSAAIQLEDVPASNASGITWHPEINQYLVVRNNSAIIYRYDVNFNYLGQITIGGLNNKDTEGLGHVGGNNVMVSIENNYVHKLDIDASSTSVNANLDVSQAYRLLPYPASNRGLEGVTARKAAGQQAARIYACQEGTAGASAPTDKMRVVYFDLPSPDPLTLLTYESNLTVIEPFQAEVAFAGVIGDIAGMVYDERTGHLIVLSERSSKALQVDPDTGAIISRLDLTGAPQYEGVTIGPNGELVFVSEGNSSCNGCEGNWARIYELPNE